MTNDHKQSVDSDQKDEILALLDYMIHHNHHHSEELQSLSEKIDEADPKDKIQAAIKQFEIGNQLLNEAFFMLGGK